MASFDVRNTTRRPAPRFPYQKAAEAALPGWDLSLAFVGPKKAKALNIALRKKDYVPNVLSYQSGEKSGEIIICLDVAEKQAPDYGMSYGEFVAFIFIHGLMHLNGYRHGTTMEVKERAFLARFISSSRASHHGSSNLRRHRHRNAPDESRGGRGSRRRARRGTSRHRNGRRSK